MLTTRLLTSLFCLLAGFSFLQAQEDTKSSMDEHVLTQEGYDMTAPAIVKIVSDAGSKIGTGALVGVTIDPKNETKIGFILTSYSMVAGRDKVAVILKNHSDALLGHVVEKWIDFDLDIAIVAVRGFPDGQPTVTFGSTKKKDDGDVLTTLMHTDASDWIPVPVELKSADATHLTFSVIDRMGLEGTPVVRDDGAMAALFVSDQTLGAGDIPLASAVKTGVVKPLLKEWFKPIKLEQKWQDKRGGGIATWMWAVGGGVLGGSVATVLALSGGDDPGTSRGLPGPPAPPPGGSQ